MGNVVKRVAQYRKRLRDSGLRPVQIWVPDVRREGFEQECRSQSLLLRDDPQEAEIMHWMGQVADTEGWK